MELNTESDIQFMARMLVMTREQNQINSADAQRLSNLAQFGGGPVPPTMPEERRQTPVNPNQSKPVYVTNQAS